MKRWKCFRQGHQWEHRIQWIPAIFGGPTHVCLRCNKVGIPKAKQ